MSESTVRRAFVERHASERSGMIGLTRRRHAYSKGCENEEKQESNDMK